MSVTKSLVKLRKVPLICPLYHAVCAMQKEREQSPWLGTDTKYSQRDTGRQIRTQTTEEKDNGGHRERTEKSFDLCPSRNTRTLCV